MPDAPPQVNAFLLCDQAFQQMGTGKWCIIGTFGVIWARDFPVTHAPLVVFVGLSDFTGETRIEVHIRDSEGSPIASVNAEIPKLPMSIAEFAFAFPPVRFEKAGSYNLELIAGGQLLTVRSFRIEKAPPMPPGAQPGRPFPRNPEDAEPSEG